MTIVTKGEPTGARLLIKMLEVKDKTDGGIHLLPETTQEDQWRVCIGKIMQMGPDCYSDPKKFSYRYCEVGDYVLVNGDVGYNIPKSGQKVRLYWDEDVLMKITEFDKSGYKDE